MHASAFLSTTARNGLNTAGDDEKVTDQHHGDSTIKGEESALGRRPASSSASRPRDDQSTEARDVFRAMDLEGSGRVGFSAFLAACLAGKPADEAASRVAFGWLDKRQRGAINGSDLQLFTGEVQSKFPATHTLCLQSDASVSHFYKCTVELVHWCDEFSYRLYFRVFDHRRHKISKC